ncbi:MAG: tRNA-intron lyase [Sulfolobales archaeon]|jgi:tRNA-intron endonuclease|nr:tRNA-intron lyase [Desulfurococcaceae archaeon]
MVKAQLVGSKLIVFDVNDARRIFSQGFFGKPLGVKKPKDTDISSPLELSLIEGMYLLENKVISVEYMGRELSIDEFKGIAISRVDNFEDLYLVYKELRKEGFIVRSGLKYGADFAVYRLRPGLEHAPYLIKVIKFNSNIDPGDLIGWGRLSHSVRKKLIIAVIYPDKEVSYIMFKWFKP